MALYSTSAEQYTTLMKLLKAQKEEQIRLLESQLEELDLLQDYLDYEEGDTDYSGAWNKNAGYIP